MFVCPLQDRENPQTETSLWTDPPLDRGPPNRDLPLDRSPSGQRPPGQRSSPRQRPPSGQRPPLDRDLAPGLTSSGSHCSGRYTSYWNAFLFSNCIALKQTQPSIIVSEFSIYFFHRNQQPLFADHSNSSLLALVLSPLVLPFK